VGYGGNVSISCLMTKTPMGETVFLVGLQLCFPILAAKFSS